MGRASNGDVITQRLARLQSNGYNTSPMIELLLTLLILSISGIGYLLERRLTKIETSLSTLWAHVRMYLPQTP